MSDYIKVCGHGYTEKCPTCREARGEQENADLIAAKDAEIAALKAELSDARDERTQADTDRMKAEAKLARYTGPLTDEQAQAAATIVASSSGIYVSGYSLKWDAAIREVRGK